METRLKKLTQIMHANGLDAVALNPGSSLAYLTGLDFHLMERPVIVLFDVDGEVSIVLPALEKGKLEALSFPVRAQTYGDNPAEWNQAFTDGFSTFAGRTLRIGVEPTRMRILEESYLQQALPQAVIVHSGPTLAALRLHKDDNELAKMRQAAIIAQNALLATLRIIRPGWTEQQIAGELTIQLSRAGSQGEGFGAIVALGENAANPHSTPGKRVLKEGDFLLIMARSLKAMPPTLPVPSLAGKPAKRCAPSRTWFTRPTATHVKTANPACRQGRWTVLPAL